MVTTILWEHFRIMEFTVTAHAIAAQMNWWQVHQIVNMWRYLSSRSTKLSHTNLAEMLQDTSWNKFLAMAILQFGRRVCPCQTWFVVSIWWLLQKFHIRWCWNHCVHHYCHQEIIEWNWITYSLTLIMTWREIVFKSSLHKGATETVKQGALENIGHFLSLAALCSTDAGMSLLNEQVDGAHSSFLEHNLAHMLASVGWLHSNHSIEEVRWSEAAFEKVVVDIENSFPKTVGTIGKFPKFIDTCWCRNMLRCIEMQPIAVEGGMSLNILRGLKIMGSVLRKSG